MLESRYRAICIEWSGLIQTNIVHILIFNRQKFRKYLKYTKFVSVLTPMEWTQNERCAVARRINETDLKLLNFHTYFHEFGQKWCDISKSV